MSGVRGRVAHSENAFAKFEHVFENRDMSLAALHTADPVVDRAQVHELQTRIRQMQATKLESRSLQTHPALGPLLPGGALKAGAAYSVLGSTTLLMAMLAGPSAAGAWCGVVGMPDFGAEAAGRFGIDLERLVLVPHPGDQWLTVTAAVVDVLSVVVLAPPARATDGDVARLSARLRQRESTLVVAGAWPQVEATITQCGIRNFTIFVLDDVILAIRDMHQPVIAAVNGAAIGGGFCLSTACDIRIASDVAYWRAAGINNGLTAAELGISYLLPRQIGFSRAFDILLTGRDVTAEEALHIGMVSQVVPLDRLLDTCYEVAERMIGFSHVGVELTKQLLWASYDAGGLHGHMNHEGQAQLYVRLTTGNFDEKIRAWREGRTPVYTDE